MKKPDPCFICKREALTSKIVQKPAKYYFLTTLDFQDDTSDPMIGSVSDPRHAVASCNDHVEDLKYHFREEQVREVPYAEWIVASVMHTVSVATIAIIHTLYMQLIFTKC